MEKETLYLIAETSGERLDKFVVAQLPELSRAQIQSMIQSGLVTVDALSVKPGIKLKGGERISITLPAQKEPVIAPENIPLHILYEDNDLAVIDKEAGLVTHPGVGNETGTLAHALLARYPEIAKMSELDPDQRTGIAHRLDKDTSGLIVIARNIHSLNNLMAQFQSRTVEKTYLALVERAPRTATGRIEAPIGRDPQNRKRMGVRRDGKNAVTEFAMIDDDFRDGQALLRVKPLTGRTHQIRVHLAFIGCPVVGDRVYGFRKQRVKLKRHFLHATELSFDHPATGERMRFVSPLPAGLRNIIEKLRAK